jgi:integrase
MPSGLKIFRWYRHTPGGKRDVVTIGPWSPTALPGHVTLHEARAKLEELKAAHRGGEVANVEAEIKKALHPEPVIAPPGSVLVSDIADDFYKRRIEPHRKRPLVAWAILKADVLPVIGRYPVGAVTTPQCAKLIERVVDRGAVVHAGKVLGLLKQMFRFAEGRGHIDRNPAAPLEPVNLGVEHNSRDRWLTGDEIKLFWSTLESTVEIAPGRHADNTMSRATVNALQILLLTGVRSCELLLARWEHVDLKAGTWTIPVETQKLSPKQARGAKPFTVPLLPMATERFTTLKKIAGESAWVMSSVPRTATGGEQPDTHFTEKALGRAMRRLWRRHGELKKLPEASPHDLRRTLRTHLGKLRVPLHVVERCLNHTLGRIVQTYDHGDYLDERREALAKWETHLAGVLSGKQKVVALPSPGAPAKKRRAP